jgi:sporulation protein YlmC with PRC-barrel domain
VKIKDEIIGKEVLDIKALVIGKVTDVEVDFETQSLVSFIVGKGGISLGSNEIVVPYDKVRIIGDKVLLNTEIQ